MRSILRGDVDKIRLPTLLTIVEMERRSGVLVAERGRQLGRLHLRDGRVVRARIEGGRRRSGAEAVYEMLNWSDGQFELWHAEIDLRDEIRASTSFLLIEGMRRLDEARQNHGGDPAVAMA